MYTRLSNRFCVVAWASCAASAQAIALNTEADYLTEIHNTANTNIIVQSGSLLILSSNITTRMGGNLILEGILDGGGVAPLLRGDSEIAVGNLQGRVKSGYLGNKVQVFAKVARPLALGESSTASPYVNLSQVWLSTRAAHESGNAAALVVTRQRDHLRFGTVGLHAMLGKRATLRATYQAQLSTNMRQHTGQVQFRIAF